MVSKNGSGNGEPKDGGFKDISVSYTKSKSKAISLPVGDDGQQMSIDAAIYWLGAIKAEHERKVSFTYTFKGWYPLDAIWALYRSLVETYGFTKVADFVVQTFFGERRTPPTMLTVDIGPGREDKVQVPWGPMAVSGVSAELIPRITSHENAPALMVTAELKNSEREQVQRVFDAAERLLEASSIYKGKAIEVDLDDDPESVEDGMPKFMDVTIADGSLVLPRAVEDQIATALWTPVERTALCRAWKIPLRRSVLLSGSYGVGKTLAAKVTARKAVENGWTFIYLKNLEHLDRALYFARKYQPAIVFAEDINRVMGGERDAEMDAMLNVIDGVDRKTDEVITVFTTNDIDEIHPAMLRPGRMDTIVEVTPPDAEAVERLVRLYGRGMIPADENLGSVGELLAGQIPAIIGEAVERSKLAAIRDAQPGGSLVVRAHHLLIAGHAMLAHAKLLAEPGEGPSDLAILGEAIGGVIANGMKVVAAMQSRDGLSPCSHAHTIDLAKDPTAGEVATKLLDIADRAQA